MDSLTRELAVYLHHCLCCHIQSNQLQDAPTLTVTQNLVTISPGQGTTVLFLYPQTGEPAPTTARHKAALVLRHLITAEVVAL